MPYPEEIVAECIKTYSLTKEQADMLSQSLNVRDIEQLINNHIITVEDFMVKTATGLTIIDAKTALKIVHFIRALCAIPKSSTYSEEPSDVDKKIKDFMSNIKTPPLVSRDAAVQYYTAAYNMTFFGRLFPIITNDRIIGADEVYPEEEDFSCYSCTSEPFSI